MTEHDVCDDCAAMEGPDDFTHAYGVDDERFCVGCNRLLGVDAALRAEIEAEIRAILCEATADGHAHGVSSLWPLTGTPRGRLKRETIQAALERMEVAGRVRRDTSGFDHIGEHEDGWWHVTTEAERRDMDDSIHAMLVAEQAGWCPACGVANGAEDDRPCDECAT